MESGEESRELVAPAAPGSPLALQRESSPFLYRLLRRIGRPMLKRVFSLHVTGLEHLPPSGPYILAANHANYLDGVVLGAAVPRKISFLVMPRVYRSTPLHPPFHRHVGSIPINLERPDPGAIKRALRILQEGGVLGIFPEGPFSLNGQLVQGQPGVAVIALRSGVSVVPVAIRGTYQALAGRPLHIPRPHPLSARFGPPLQFGPIRRGRKVPHAVRDEVTRRIMAEIAALLSHPLPARGAGGE
ncbi:MAG: 1-acyl-sn-glycerol-3-phosphate acyltransferase [Candidatus Rokubacteria bacterium]|nr:1-acyl-sn-glycerol-3-phosphate acyltransferase [Candidatus Rokubacteria bacterium]